MPTFKQFIAAEPEVPQLPQPEASQKWVSIGDDIPKNYTSIRLKGTTGRFMVRKGKFFFKASGAQKYTAITREDVANCEVLEQDKVETATEQNEFKERKEMIQKDTPLAAAKNNDWISIDEFPKPPSNGKKGIKARYKVEEKFVEGYIYLRRKQYLFLPGTKQEADLALKEKLPTLEQKKETNPWAEFANWAESMELYWDEADAALKKKIKEGIETKSEKKIKKVKKDISDKKKKEEARQKEEKAKKKAKKEKEQQKIREHYPMDKVLNEEFLREKMQTIVYPLFQSLKSSAKGVTTEQMDNFHFLMSDAFWFTNRMSEYGKPPKRNSMNSLQSYVIFTNIHILLDDLINNGQYANDDWEQKLGIRRTWCKKIIEYLDFNIENGEIMTFFTPSITTGYHNHKNLVLDLGENRLELLKNFYHVRQKYAGELGVNYGALNMPPYLLEDCPEWIKQMPIMGKDIPFVYNESDPISLIGKKIQLKAKQKEGEDEQKEGEAKQKEGEDEDEFYRIVAEKMADSLVLHKIIPYENGGTAKFIHIDFSSAEIVATEKNMVTDQESATDQESKFKIVPVVEDAAEDAKIPVVDATPVIKEITYMPPGAVVPVARAADKFDQLSDEQLLQMSNRGQLEEYGIVKSATMTDELRSKIKDALRQKELQVNNGVVDNSLIKENTNVIIVKGSFKNKRGVVKKKLISDPNSPDKFQVKVDNTLEIFTQDQLKFQTEEQVIKADVASEKKEEKKMADLQSSTEELIEEESKKNEPSYQDGVVYDVLSLSYPEFEPKTVFFDPRTFAFLIDFIKPVLHENDYVIFRHHGELSHGQIRYISTDKNDNLEYYILKNANENSWQLTKAISSMSALVGLGLTKVTSSEILGINHMHINTGVKRQQISDSKQQKNESMANYEAEILNELSTELIVTNGLVFPYRTESKVSRVSMGTFVGLKLKNADSAFEMANFLDTEEIRYFKSALPHPGMLTTFREEQNMEKQMSIELLEDLKEADPKLVQTIPHQAKFKGLVEISEKMSLATKRIDQIQNELVQIKIKIIDIRRKLNLSEDLKRNEQQRQTKIESLLIEKDKIISKEKNASAEALRSLEDKKSKIDELIQKNARESIGTDSQEFNNIKNERVIKQLKEKEQEILDKMLELEKEQSALTIQFEEDRATVVQTELNELIGLRKQFGIKYTNSNPLLTFMVTEGDITTMHHIPKEDIEETPVHQYLVFFDLFKKALTEKWDLQMEKNAKKWEIVPKNPFMFYFYLMDEENEFILDNDLKMIVKRIKGVFKGKVDTTSQQITTELGVTDYHDKLHFDNLPVTSENYPRIVPIPKVNGLLYKIVLNRTMVSEEHLGLTFTSGVTKENWSEIPYHARTMINSISKQFEKAITNNTRQRMYKNETNNETETYPQRYDVLLKVNGVEINTIEDFNTVISSGNMVNKDEIILDMFMYYHPTCVLPSDNVSTASLDLTNNYEFTEDGKFAFILLLGMVAERVFRNYEEEVDFTKPNIIDTYVDIYEWMALRQEKALQHYDPWIPVRMAVSDTNNTYQLPDLKKVKAQSLRHLNIRVLGGRPVCNACQQGYETYYGNIFYNDNLANLFAMNKDNSMLTGIKNVGSMVLNKGGIAKALVHMSKKMLSLLYSQPRPLLGIHRNKTGMCIESLAKILEPVSSIEQLNANGWFLNWVGTWQQASARYEKWAQKQQDYFDNMDPRYSMTNWFYNAMMFKLDIFIKKWIINFSDVPLPEEETMDDGMGHPVPKNNTFNKDIENEEAKNNAEENGEAPPKGSFLRQGWDWLSGLSFAGIAKSTVRLLWGIVKKMYEYIKKFIGGVKSTIQTLLGVMYKLFMMFMTTPVFRILIIKGIDLCLEEVCIRLNVEMDNYQMSNDGKKFDENTGSWLKMTAEEKLKQAADHAEAAQSQKYYQLRAFGLLLGKVGAGSFAAHAKKFIDVNLMGENNVFKKIFGFLQEIPYIGGMIKYAGLDPDSLSKLILGTISTCWQDTWETLKRVNNNTVDLSKMYDVFKKYQKCMDNARNKQTVFLEKGALPGEAAPYLNFAWERINYNIPFYAIQILNEIEFRRIKDEKKRFFLSLTDPQQARATATRESKDAANKRDEGTLDNNVKPVSVQAFPTINESSKIMTEKLNEAKKKYIEAQNIINEMKTSSKVTQNEEKLRELRLEMEERQQQIIEYEVNIQMEVWRQNTNESRLMEDMGDQIAQNITGAWKRCRTFFPGITRYLEDGFEDIQNVSGMTVDQQKERRLETYIYNEITKGCTTWMVPGGENAVEISADKATVMYAENDRKMALLKHEEDLFKFKFHQNQLFNLQRDENNIGQVITPVTKPEDWDDEEDGPYQSSGTDNATIEAKKKDIKIQRQKLHGTIKPRGLAYLPWALGEENYLPNKSFNKWKHCLINVGGNFMKDKTTSEDVNNNPFTIQAYKASNGGIFGKSYPAGKVTNEIVTRQLQLELCSLRLYINLIIKVHESPDKDLNSPDVCKWFMDANRDKKKYGIFEFTRKPNKTFESKSVMEILLKHRNVIDPWNANMPFYVCLFEGTEERGKYDKATGTPFEKLQKTGYLKRLKERRSALQAVLKYRTALINYEKNDIETAGFQKLLSPQEYNKRHDELLNKYRDELIQCQKNVQKRISKINSDNLKWWAGAIVCAGAIGLFIASGGAAALFTGIANTASAAVGSVSAMTTELGAAAATKLGLLKAFLVEKSKTMAGSVLLITVKKVGSELYNQAIAAVQLFMKQFLYEDNQKFLMMTSGAVGAYAVAKMAQEAMHADDYSKSFCLNTVFGCNKVWKRIFWRKLTNRVDEFKSNLTTAQEEQAVTIYEDQSTLPTTCDSTTENCAENDYNDGSINMHPRIASIRLRRNFIERATVNINWAGCDSFTGSDLPFLNVHRAASFFDAYHKLTLKSPEKGNFLFGYYRDEHNGVDKLTSNDSWVDIEDEKKEETKEEKKEE
jgi:hypothetical protein